MKVRDAVASRYSCRAFLPTSVPETIVRDIVGRAARAPSAANIQPWRVDAIAGDRLEALLALLRPRMDELPKGEGTEYEIYPRALAEPYSSRRFAVGDMLYRSIGVTREDKAGRYRQYARNFEFFGAPVGLFISTERHFVLGSGSTSAATSRTSCCLRASTAFTPVRRKPGRHSPAPSRPFSTFPLP